MTTTDSVSRYVATSDGLKLAVYEDGPAEAPAVVLVHGYPDNHHVWDGVTAELGDAFRVIRYDVRGAGGSEAPARRRDYRIEQLVDDLGRVIDATSPQAPVHLVAHDWGSIQCWDALPDESLGLRIRSYTSISGPSLDYSAVWMRGIRHGVRARLGQLLESYYIGLFMTPLVPELLARCGVVDRLAHVSAGLGSPAVLPETAEFERGVAETVHGIQLYRANVPRRFLRPRPPKVTLPVQLIVPSREIHVSIPLAEESPTPYVSDLSISRIEGNHWVVSQRPVEIADRIRGFVDGHASVAGAATDGKDIAR